MFWIAWALELHPDCSSRLPQHHQSPSFSQTASIKFMNGHDALMIRRASTNRATDQKHNTTNCVVTDRRATTSQCHFSHNQVHVYK